MVKDIIMSKAMLECQNRPEVIEKKRNTMVELHNGSSKEALAFQKRYREGFKLQRERTYTKCVELLKTLYGYDLDSLKHIPTKHEDLRLMLNRWNTSNRHWNIKFKNGDKTKYFIWKQYENSYTLFTHVDNKWKVLYIGLRKDCVNKVKQLKGDKYND